MVTISTFSWLPYSHFQRPPYSPPALPSLPGSLQLQMLEHPIGWASSLCFTLPSSSASLPCRRSSERGNLPASIPPSMVYPTFRMKFKCFRVMPFKVLCAFHHSVNSHYMFVDFNCTEISQLIVKLSYLEFFQDTEVLKCGLF